MIDLFTEEVISFDGGTEIACELMGVSAGLKGTNKRRRNRETMQQYFRRHNLESVLIDGVTYVRTADIIQYTKQAKLGSQYPS